MASVAPMYFDSHMHTPLCKHALGEPEEYARRAREVGLKGIVMTCHSPMPNGFSHAVRMSPDEFDDYVSLVERASRWGRDENLEVRLGLESDWFPGMESWLRELHARAPFHFILGSVHYHIREYRERFWRGDPVEFQRGYFRHLAEAAETGLFDCLSHPDLVKNQFPDSWNFEAVAGVVAESLDRIQAVGVAMEINTSGLHKSVQEMNPGPVMLKMMVERRIPIVIGSDSHQPKRVGAQFLEALDMLAEAGGETVSYFQNRKRVDLPLAQARESLLG